jgi:predicted GH43/DUF377 family glycosyl hydrolase
MDLSSITREVNAHNKCGNLILKASYKKGSFDSHAVDCPFVFRHNGKYFMTFVGWDTIGYRTGMAVSDDLESWKKTGVLIDRGSPGSYTEYNIAMTNIIRNNELFGSGEVRKIDGKYIGTYHAYPGEGYEVGPGMIGICYSEDLMKWVVEDPVLFPEKRYAWEAGGLYKSWLMEHDGVFYLFYNAKNVTEGDWKEQIGFAYSNNLRDWMKYPLNPIITTGERDAFDGRFASDPSVLYHDGYWLLFYFGLSYDGHARDSVAYSSDFLTWYKTNEILIDIGPEGSVDSKYAHKPSLIAKEGTLYHFYCAVSPSKNGVVGEIETDEIRGISYATSK